MSETYQGLLALGSCMLGLSTIAIALRFYSRISQKTPLKADDWLMIPTLIFLAGTVGADFYGVHRKTLGYPTPKNPLIVKANAATSSKILIVLDLFSVATLGCCKLSALFFYHRIFCVRGRGDVFRRIIIATVVVVILWIVAFELLSGLQCGTHFSALWSGPADYVKYCKKTSYPFLLGLTISDFLLDLWTICLPIPKVWTLKTTPSRKVSVIGVFLLALVSFAANIARLVVFVQIENTEEGGPSAAATIDGQLVNTKSEFLILLEAGMACIAVNLPSLWFLVGTLTPESVIRSIRSVISLASIRSNGSRGSGRDKASNTGVYTGKPGSSIPSTSESRLAPGEPTETVAMYDLESFSADTPKDNVHVTKTVSQHIDG